MANRFFAKAFLPVYRGRLAGMCAVSGLGGYALFKDTPRYVDVEKADKEFHTSSQHTAPPGYTPWKIRNDYPTSDLLKSQNKATKLTPGSPPTLPLPGYGDDFEGENAPWLKIDFEKNPELYAEAIREYCFDGMVPADFRPQDNTVRNWYHAPWMHYRASNTSGNEREPLHGLTFERVTPKYEFARTQDTWLQNWACGFYNATGATVFGDMWKNPAAPDFNNNKHFPTGTCVFKILLNNATNDQLPNMYGSPSMHAVICSDPPTQPAPKNGRNRDTKASELRLIQVDFAVVDNRSPIGWVFGTYMYDCEVKDKEPWNRLTLVGLQWGNDPWLTQAVHTSHPEMKPRESWINPKAEDWRKVLAGSRPSWGWNGRMNGPADNFISACASCHSTASRDPIYLGKDKTPLSIVPPLKTVDGVTAPEPPKTDADVMIYFRNVPPGVPFDEGLDPDDLSRYDPSDPKLKSKTKSADYSLQLQVGWASFNLWQQNNQSWVEKSLRGTRYVVGLENKPDPADISQRDLLRQGPEVKYKRRD
ncbi:hypothetical protein FZEAL_3238 [Fusarium zealandicum]|uniref:Cytochrome c domain-containing protein n=1 Tax=Fusarium zealandicum TaxID=1053134 RepID=A0A8H4UPZ4_9HYPO|nr:hypothetical protein FZEAL_3238 [Fusarium zealandicum]